MSRTVRAPPRGWSAGFDGPDPAGGWTRIAEQPTAERGARVLFIPPPLYYIAAFVGGLVFNDALPLPVGGRPGTAIAGAAIAALGLILACPESAR